MSRESATKRTLLTLLANASVAAAKSFTEVTRVCIEPSDEQSFDVSLIAGLIVGLVTRFVLSRLANR
jgi:hypothetical protein